MKLPASSKASQMILLTGLLLILTISSNLPQPAVALKLPSFFAWMQPQPQPQSHSPTGSSNHAQVHSISSAAASTSVMGSGSSGSSGMADAEPMLSSASAFESANSAPPISGYPANSLRRPFQSMLLLPGRHHHSNQINLFSSLPKSLFGRLLSGGTSSSGSSAAQFASDMGVSSPLAQLQLPQLAWTQHGPFPRMPDQKVSMFPPPNKQLTEQQQFHSLPSTRIPLNQISGPQQDQRPQMANIQENSQQQQQHALGYAENSDFMLVEAPTRPLSDSNFPGTSGNSEGDSRITQTSGAAAEQQQQQQQTIEQVEQLISSFAEATGNGTSSPEGSSSPVMNNTNSSSAGSSQQLMLVQANSNETTANHEADLLAKLADQIVVELTGNGSNGTTSSGSELNSTLASLSGDQQFIGSQVNSSPIEQSSTVDSLESSAADSIVEPSHSALNGNQRVPVLAPPSIPVPSSVSPAPTTSLSQAYELAHNQGDEQVESFILGPYQIQHGNGNAALSQGSVNTQARSPLASGHLTGNLAANLLQHARKSLIHLPFMQQHLQGSINGAKMIAQQQAQFIAPSGNNPNQQFYQEATFGNNPGERVISRRPPAMLMNQVGPQIQVNSHHSMEQGAQPSSFVTAFSQDNYIHHQHLHRPLQNQQQVQVHHQRPTAYIGQQQQFEQLMSPQQQVVPAQAAQSNAATSWRFPDPQQQQQLPFSAARLPHYFTMNQQLANNVPVSSDEQQQQQAPYFLMSPSTNSSHRLQSSNSLPGLPFTSQRLTATHNINNNPMPLRFTSTRPGSTPNVPYFIDSQRSPQTQSSQSNSLPQSQSQAKSHSQVQPLNREQQQQQQQHQLFAQQEYKSLPSNQQANIFNDIQQQQTGFRLVVSHDGNSKEPTFFEQQQQPVMMGDLAQFSIDPQRSRASLAAQQVANRSKAGLYQIESPKLNNNNQQQQQQQVLIGQEQDVEEPENIEQQQQQRVKTIQAEDDDEDEESAGNEQQSNSPADSRKVGASMGVLSSSSLRLPARNSNNSSSQQQPVDKAENENSASRSLSELRSLKLTQDITLYDFEGTPSDTLSAARDRPRQQAPVSFLDTQVYTLPYTLSMQSSSGRPQHSSPPMFRQINNTPPQQPQSSLIGHFPLGYLPAPAPAQLQQQQQQRRPADLQNSSPFRALYREFSGNQQQQQQQQALGSSPPLEWTSQPRPLGFRPLEEPESELDPEPGKLQQQQQHYFHYQPVAQQQLMNGLVLPQKQVTNANYVRGNQQEQQSLYNLYANQQAQQQQQQQLAPNQPSSSQFVVAIQHGASNELASMESPSSPSHSSLLAPVQMIQNTQLVPARPEDDRIQSVSTEVPVGDHTAFNSIETFTSAAPPSEFQQHQRQQQPSELNAQQPAGEYSIEPVESTGRIESAPEVTVPSTLADQEQQQTSSTGNQQAASSFCANKPAGLYADEAQRCRAYYQCAPTGHQMFRCNNQTQFNQKTQNCDWWYNVNCAGKTGSPSDFLQDLEQPHQKSSQSGTQALTSDRAALVTPNAVTPSGFSSTLSPVDLQHAHLDDREASGSSSHSEQHAMDQSAVRAGWSTRNTEMAGTGSGVGGEGGSSEGGAANGNPSGSYFQHELQSGSTTTSTESSTLASGEQAAPTSTTPTFALTTESGAGTVPPPSASTASYEQQATGQQQATDSPYSETFRPKVGAVNADGLLVGEAAATESGDEVSSSSPIVSANSRQTEAAAEGAASSSTQISANESNSQQRQEPQPVANNKDNLPAQAPLTSSSESLSGASQDKSSSTTSLTSFNEQLSLINGKQQQQPGNSKRLVTSEFGLGVQQKTQEQASDANGGNGIGNEAGTGSNSKAARSTSVRFEFTRQLRQQQPAASSLLLSTHADQDSPSNRQKSHIPQIMINTENNNSLVTEPSSSAAFASSAIITENDLNQIDQNEGQQHAGKFSNENENHSSRIAIESLPSTTTDSTPQKVRKYTRRFGERLSRIQ